MEKTEFKMQTNSEIFSEFFSKFKKLKTTIDSNKRYKIFLIGSRTYYNDISGLHIKI